MKKVNLLILPVLFVGFITFMFLNQVFSFKTFENDGENRTMAEFPSLDFRHLDNYPTEFEAYINDGFRFRKPFLQIYHDIKYWLDVSPDSEDVIIGENKQLFLARKDQEIYKGQHAYTVEKLDSMDVIWQERNEYFKEREIPFYWLVAPNKHNVYFDDFPINMPKDIESRTYALANYFNERFSNRLVYPREEMIANKEGAYHLYDNHWTEKGAFIGYQAIMQRIKQDIPSLEILNSNDFTWKTKETNNGSLAIFIGRGEKLWETISVADFEDELENLEELDIKMTEDFPYPWEYKFHYRYLQAPNSKRVLIVRDSFGSFIVPFFARSFTETLFIFDSWKYGLNQEIMDAFQPDIVIYLTMESFTDNVLEYPAIIESE